MKSLTIAFAGIAVAAASACTITTRERIVDSRATDTVVIGRQGSIPAAGTVASPGPAEHSAAEWRRVPGTGGVARPVMPGS